LQRTLAGGRDRSCLTELAEFLAAVKNGENFDRIGVHAIHEAVRPRDELADFGAGKFGDDAAGLGKLARLVEPTCDAVEELLGVDG
jgi:hypothetical protein